MGIVAKIAVGIFFRFLTNNSPHLGNGTQLLWKMKDYGSPVMYGLSNSAMSDDL